MPTLLWQRDLISDADGVRNSFSSWDSCMAESYCKWPAIAAIIVGSLIVISIIWCCARCLCCGLECCCGACSCFNRCCPSPRRSKQGYEKPQAYPYNSQYQSAAPPTYFGGGGYRGPQTATFDAPSNKPYNEDSLPAMPTWSNAQSRQIEHHEDNDDVAMEMKKLYPTQQQQGVSHQRNESDDSTDGYGDIGRMPASPYQEQSQNFHSEPARTMAASPYQEQTYNPYPEHNDIGRMPVSPYQDSYPEPANNLYHPQPSPYHQASHDYSQHQQYAGSPSTAAPSSYLPAYNTRAPSSVYTTPYSAAPPYATNPPSIASPQPQHARMPSAGTYGGTVGRKPVSGSWRDI